MSNMFSFSATHNAQKAFTLIELLVVISIIGLLSSITLSSLTSARDKSRIASGQQFSSHTNQGIGSDAVALWTFDEGSGSTLTDVSKQNHDGVITNPVWTTGIFRNALNFSAANSFVTVPPSSAFDASDNVTIMAWVNTSSNGSQQVVTESWGNCCHPDKSVSIAGGRIYFYARAVGGSAGNAYSSVGILSNKWQHIAVTATEGQRPNFYIDGKLVNDSASTQTYSKVNKRNGDKVTIGAMPGPSGINHGQFFIGTIDELGIYAESFSFSKIEQYFAMTSPKYIALNNALATK